MSANILSLKAVERVLDLAKSCLRNGQTRAARNYHKIAKRMLAETAQAI